MSVQDLPSLDSRANVHRLCEAITDASLDISHVYVSDLHDLRWLTGFSGSNGFGVVDVGSQTTHVFTDSRYSEQAVSEGAVVNAKLCVHTPRNASEQETILSDVISGGRLSVDTQSVSAFLFAQLSENFAVISTPSLFGDIRRVKSTAEIARMRHAAAIADTALQHVVQCGLEGRTEREIQAELEYHMLRNGADGSSFDTIVAAGENAALPHHRPSDRVITRDDAVVIDIGALVDGYHSDMTRTVRVGSLSREIAFLLAAVTAAQSAALAHVRAGASTVEIDDAARQVFREVNADDLFVHGLGHGVGLAIHEEPFLSRRPGTTLREGEVVTIEPGLYRVGVGGVRIEDLVVVTKDGYQSLTNTRKDVSCPPSVQTI